MSHRAPIMRRDGRAMGARQPLEAVVHACEHCPPGEARDGCAPCDALRGAGARYVITTVGRGSFTVSKRTNEALMNGADAEDAQVIEAVVQAMEAGDWQKAADLCTKRAGGMSTQNAAARPLVHAASRMTGAEMTEHERHGVRLSTLAASRGVPEDALAKPDPDGLTAYDVAEIQRNNERDPKNPITREQYAASKRRAGR